jgi:catechol 1,2-dioxygenase
VRVLPRRAAPSLLLALAALSCAPPASAADCRPTPSDALGPFYVPGAPVRSSVGKGYVLTGTVRSSRGCGPLAGARVEVWLTGPDGYDAAHRATVVADAEGHYAFESARPPPYERRPPHLHLRVAHPGFRTLVTQHYPAAGQAAATFDLVLAPER